MSDTLRVIATQDYVREQIEEADNRIGASLAEYATKTYVNDEISHLVNSAPETLNTLNELASALGEDPNFATTVAAQIGNKVEKVDGKQLSTNDYTNEEKNKLGCHSEETWIFTLSDGSTVTKRVVVIME